MKCLLSRYTWLAAVALVVAAVVALYSLCGGFAAPPHDLMFVGLGGMIVNRDNLNAMYNGFKTAYANAFAGVQTAWPKIATPVPSTAKTENYGWLGEFPQLREWIGDRQVKSIAASGYAVTNKKFESTIGVPRDDIEDDSYGVLTPLFAQMGYAAATHPDSLIWAQLAAGFTTPCFDGQYFFDVDHPVGAGVVSNYDSTGGGNPWYLLDTSRPLKPLIFQKRRDYALKAMTDINDEAVFMRDEYRYGVDARANVGYGFWQMAYASKNTLNGANFDAAVAIMQGFKSDEGRPLGISPNLLVVGPSNRAAGRGLIEAETLATGASNTNFKAVELLVCPWLP